MSDTQHIGRDELLQMLGSEEETAHTNLIGEHLHQCSSCRDKLDSLAAQSEIWNKAPAMLKSDLPMRTNLGSHGLETRDLPDSRERESSYGSQEWSWPIESILDPPKHPEMIGRIGDYDIEREIGRGGMGIVLKAHEAELNRPLAIKVLAPHLASHGTARQRFAKEARSAAGVIHPNVIGVYRVENGDRIPYIVMPYINGPSLQKLVEDNGPLSEEEIVQMSLQISAGLTAAHSHGLVHRDIKPANMLVDGGNRLMITDFGLARAEDDASLTRTGWLTGTPNYMSPEQTRGERLDHRSDLFSLGSLIYFLSTGRLPFRSDTPFGVLRRIQEDTPTPVRQVNRGISKTLADIIDVLLEKDPADRIQSAAELHEVLSKQMFYLHQPDVSQPPVVPKKCVMPVSGSNFRWGGFVAAAVAATFGAWMLTPWLFPQEEDQPQQEKAVSKIVAEVSPVEKIELSVQEQQMVESAIESVRKPAVTVVVKQDREDDLKAKKSFEKGMELLAEEKYQKAIEAFKKSATTKSYSGVSQYNIACSYALSGETEKALVCLELAVDEGFDDFEQFDEDEDLKSLRDEDRFKELLADLKELEQAREQLGLALNMIDRGEIEAAVKELQGVIEIDPENQRAWLNMGYAIHMKGDYDEALKWHRKAAAGGSFAPLALYNIACVHAIKGRKDKSFSSLDEALEKGLIDHLGVDHLDNDSDLENLRDDERYESFVARFTEKKEAKMKWLNSTQSKSDECDEGDCLDAKRDDSASSSDDPILRRGEEDEDEDADDEVSNIEFQAA